MSIHDFIKDLKDYAIVNDSIIADKAAELLIDYSNVIRVLGQFLQHKEYCSINHINNKHIKNFNEADFCDCSLADIIFLCDMIEIDILYKKELNAYE